MSQEKALKTLESIGFTQLDAKVYVFLAKKGLQKAGDIAKCLKIPKQSIYFIIRHLQSKGIVTSTVERPARFSAVPFGRVLDLFVNAKMDEAKQIQKNKDEILLDWQSIVLTETEEDAPKFAVLKGRNVIYSKIQEMIQQTEKHLLAMINFPNLIRASQLGFLDALSLKSKKSSVQFRLLTELSEENLNIVNSVIKTSLKQISGFEVRIPDLGFRISSRMIIRDNREAVFFIDRGANFSDSDKGEVCLWTDCESLVQSFSAVFEDLWFNATNIQKELLKLNLAICHPKHS